MQTATGHTCAMCYNPSPGFHCQCQQQRAGFSDDELVSATRILEDKIRGLEDSLDDPSRFKLADCNMKLGLLHFKYGKLRKAEEHLRIALNILLEFSMWQEDVARIRDALGDLYHRQGKLDEAREEHAQARSIRVCLPVPAHDLAKSNNSMAIVSVEMGMIPPGSLWFKEADEMLPDDSPIRDSLMLDRLVSRARVTQDERDLHLLHQLLRLKRCGVIWTPVAEKEPFALATCELANSYIRLNIKLDVAEDMLHSALEVMNTTFPCAHFTKGRIHHCIGNVCYQKDKYDGALAALEEAEDVYRQTIGTDNIHMADNLSLAGDILMRHGRLDRAAAKFEEAVSIVRCICNKLGPQGNDLLGDRLRELALCRAFMKDVAGVAACLRECRELSGISEDLSSECAAKLAELEGE
mmetsp:Transcript_39825/g.93190  ORF Transcript_39825/g.93190 Transcript_39825/m.93190 type:complete len:410 (-) Transcript_39825:30-1259(-)